MKKKEQLRMAYIKHTGEKPSMNRSQYVRWLEDKLLEYLEPGIVSDTENRMRTIAYCVACAFDIPEMYLYKQTNKAKYSHPRYVAIEIMPKYIRINTNTSPIHFGLKSHSSYYRAVEFVNNNMRYKDFQGKYNKAISLINQSFKTKEAI